MIELKHRDILLQTYQEQGSTDFGGTFEVEYLESPQTDAPETLRTLEQAGYIDLNPEPQTRYWRSPMQQHLLNQFAQSKGCEWFEPLPDEHWPEFQALCQEQLGYAPSPDELSYVWIQSWCFQLTEKGTDFCIGEGDRP